MSVARATTPTFTCTFTEQSLDLTTANNVYVTFSQGMRAITKTGEDLVISPKQIEVYLSQQETLPFVEGAVKVQANWTGANGRRAASFVEIIELSEQLLKRVVE